MNFASDNAAGIAPAILQALGRANAGFALSYGNDDLSRAVERRLSELFEREVAVYLVATGTAANALAIAHVSPPWGAVLCHEEAHIACDEAGAPEFFGGGLKLVPLRGEHGKIAPATLTAAFATFRGEPHSVLPAVLSLTQATEAGTVYSNAEVAALSAVAHERGLAVHMDGARFGNALARLGSTPAEATWKAGVDVLSFGATKGGAMAAEAVIFFDPERARAMPSRRKRSGHLVSKHRYLAAQFDAYLRDDLWLRLARHANAAASGLAAGLAAHGLPPVSPVEANEVFVRLPMEADRRLKEAGAAYYHWDVPDAGTGLVLVRLVTSFASTEAEVERFVQLAAGG
jgi:threonine aldolase